MQKMTIALLLLITAQVWFGCKESQPAETSTAPPAEEWQKNMAYKWAEVALQGTANDTDRNRPRPTVTSRMLALIWTSVYDAWTRYDAKALPMYLTEVPRRPAEEHTLANKEKAISYAAYRTLLEYYPADSALFTEKLVEFGFDPNDTSMDDTTPAGIGNKAAATVIASRRHDGSNQDGDEKGSNGAQYSDYTGYKPVNTVDKLVDINRWQPIRFEDGKGGHFVPACLTPHWPKVKPIVLDSSAQFRPIPPPYVGSPELEKEVAQVLSMNANLTFEEKALVEFMRDGPSSVQQAGHWLIFAQFVSRRDKHDLDQDVKMYLMVLAAAADAFIACWDAKMHYDFARPFALVRYYNKGKMIKGWGGPFKGTVDMKGEEWIPYSPATFVSPPFPSYVSGHSTVSGACSEILKLHTGRDTFGQQVKLLPGWLTEVGITKDSVVLDLPTFTETAEKAGISRVLGGYHIQSENIIGLELGRKVAAEVFRRLKARIEGTELVAAK